MPQVRKNLEKTPFIHRDFKILGIEQCWSISQVPLQLEKALWLGFLPDGCRDKPAHCLWSVGKPPHQRNPACYLFLSILELNTWQKATKGGQDLFWFLVWMSPMYLGHKTWFQEYEETSYIVATSREPQEMSTERLAAFFWSQSVEQCKPTFNCGLPFPIIPVWENHHSHSQGFVSLWS